MTKRIAFVTTNLGKVEEAVEIGREYNIEVEQLNYDALEIQADSGIEVGIESARDAYKKFKRPLIVEDSGMFIEALSGFPGVYSAFVFKTIGTEGILKLMEGKKDRKAEMKSALVYIDKDQIRIFEGVSEGRISESARGRGGFGYDPIFIPTGFERTFAEDPKLKQQVSHRAKAFRAFLEWYSGNSGD